MSASKAKKTAPEKDTITVEADFFEALLAAVGPDKFNMAAYKKMAHFSTTGRTVSSFEHFFRDRKKKAIAMLAAEPEDTVSPIIGVLEFKTDHYCSRRTLHLRPSTLVSVKPM